MYTLESYLTYVAAAVILSTLVFAVVLVFWLVDTVIRHLTFAARVISRRAGRVIADRAVLPVARHAVQLLSQRQVIPALPHVVQLLAERPASRSLVHHGATEHTH